MAVSLVIISQGGWGGWITQCLWWIWQWQLRELCHFPRLTVWWREHNCYKTSIHSSHYPSSHSVQPLLLCNLSLQFPQIPMSMLCLRKWYPSPNHPTHPCIPCKLVHLAILKEFRAELQPSIRPLPLSSSTPSPTCKLETLAPHLLKYFQISLDSKVSFLCINHYSTPTLNHRSTLIHMKCINARTYKMITGFRDDFRLMPDHLQYNHECFCMYNMWRR